MLRTENTPAPSPSSRFLVSTDWLAERVRDPHVAIVDGSYFLPTQKRDAHAEYREGHIPGAVFFDIEEHRARDMALAIFGVRVALLGRQEI